MNQQRGQEDTDHRRPELVSGREGECQQLALVTEFGDEDEHSGDEEGIVHIGSVTPRRTAAAL